MDTQILKRLLSFSPTLFKVFTFSVTFFNRTNYFLPY